MDAIEPHVVGQSEGYEPGTVFRLADGTAWVRVDRGDEYVLRDMPRARVWQDSTGAHMLDLGGMSGVVRIERRGGAGGVLRVLTALT
jgi:hypothetical protein